MHSSEKTPTQLQIEAVEFLQERRVAISEQIKQLTDYLAGIDAQIVKLGGVVPVEAALYELVEHALKQQYRVVREDELISAIVTATPWLSVRNPEAQLQKAITQSCKVWKNKPTKFFRHDGWVGLYAWKEWILQAHPDQRNLANCIMEHFDVSPTSAKTLADSLIESGAILLQE